MARRSRKGQPLHGWLNIDKPAGMTSAACVAAVRSATGAAKLGHAGTLDPLASGVLPVALGEATKTVGYLQQCDKTYRFVVRWGERRATDDAEGDVVATSDHRPTAADVERAAPAFVGTIRQMPPAFSAVKVNGERAYALARDGVEVDLAPREVEIHELILVGTDGPDMAEFVVVCGKGMYVRALARDLAQLLGTEGHLAGLVREAVGPFRLADAILLANLKELGHIAGHSEVILPIETALADIPALALSADEAARLRNGQPVPIMRPADRDLLDAAGENEHLLVTEGGRVVAMVRAQGIQVHPVRVFNI